MSSVRSVSSSAPSHSGTTTVDLFVAQEEVDVGSLQQSLLSLSDDLLSVELQLHRLHGSCEGLACGCSSLSERVDALHSSLASLCEKTEVISNYTQVVVMVPSNVARVADLPNPLLGVTNESREGGRIDCGRSQGVRACRRGGAARPARSSSEAPLGTVRGSGEEDRVRAGPTGKGGATAGGAGEALCSNGGDAGARRCCANDEP